MTTKVTVRNDNLAGGLSVRVMEVNELGDPGTARVLPPDTDSEFWIHSNLSLKVEQIAESERALAPDEDSDAGGEGGPTPVDARDDEEKTV